MRSQPQPESADRASVPAGLQSWGASGPAGFPSSVASGPTGPGRGSVGVGRAAEEELHRARPGVEVDSDGRPVRPIVGTRPSWSREHGVTSIPMPEADRGPTEKQWTHMRALVESLVNQNLNLQDRLDRMEEEAAMRSATSGGGGAPPSADTVDLIDLEPRRPTPRGEVQGTPDPWSKEAWETFGIYSLPSFLAPRVWSPLNSSTRSWSTGLQVNEVHGVRRRRSSASTRRR